MSYCVNCGVELGGDLSCCPLCGTPVINPNKACPCPGSVPGFFPSRREEVPRVSKREISLLLSAMLASVSLCCAIANLVLRPDIIWSLYAAGACAALWIFIVLPLLARDMPTFLKVAADLTAVALYVLLIAVNTGGMDWYLRLALPIIVGAELISIVISLLLRGGRRSTLGSIIIFLVGIGLMSMLTELLIDLYLERSWTPGWSLIVLTVCLGFLIPLIVVRLVPSMRMEARRRFHL